MKLNKTELKQREDILTRLQQAKDRLEEGVNAFNENMQRFQDELMGDVDAYNNILCEAKEFAESIGSRIDEEVADKSEKWQESDKAVAIEEMKNNWEGLDLEELDVEFPNELDLSLDHADEFEAAPLEPDAA